MADVHVSIDGDRHDVGERREAGDDTEGADEDAESAAPLEPHLPLHDTCSVRCVCVSQSLSRKVSVSSVTSG